LVPNLITNSILNLLNAKPHHRSNLFYYQSSRQRCSDIAHCRITLSLICTRSHHRSNLCNTRFHHKCDRIINLVSSRIKSHHRTNLLHTKAVDGVILIIARWHSVRIVNLVSSPIKSHHRTNLQPTSFEESFLQRSHRKSSFITNQISSQN